MDPTKNSVNHLENIIDKLNNKEPFAIIRPGDGEYYIMINRQFNTQDNWSFKGGQLHDDLLNIKDIIKDINNIFVGIPCKECQGYERVIWFKNIWDLKENYITYANIFCNKNWKTFTDYLINNNFPLFYIGPGTNKNTKLNIEDIFNIDPYLVNNWDTQKSTFINNIDTWVSECIINSNKTICTFVFSAGPISKYIIPILYKKYPTHQFLDVGSSLDYFMKGSSNRGYINPNDMYANIICDFNSGHVN